ncbi:hypothetical protein HMPREF9696_01750 [Afipia clevelandensis ATCC 49720]|uniref:Uncharacterized protein n=1 Tax=Afipia clevelandensis ATCC 49720 TaxID=883079 RepID=K8PE13_9BRAD|nr:hypothetical protein HMPREF9696_01750 [Afipia clevelandensis ATCC 49720]
MRLTSEEISKLPVPFSALQACMAGGVQQSTHNVAIWRADGTVEWIGGHHPDTTLNPGDEVELVPKANSGSFASDVRS